MGNTIANENKSQNNECQNGLVCFGLNIKRQHKKRINQEGRLEQGSQFNPSIHNLSNSERHRFVLFKDSF